MNFKLSSIGIFLTIGAVAHGQVLLGSFTWSGNGHVYEAWGAANGISYQDAAVFAGTRGGTLATITSQSEDDAVIANLGGVMASTSYLGAQQSPNETDPSGGWNWVTGESWSYTNWASGEPNDFNGSASEQFLEMYTNGTWNDIGDNSSGFNNGFLVEAVPEPSSMLALGIFGGFLLKRRKTS